MSGEHNQMRKLSFLGFGVSVHNACAILLGIISTWFTINSKIDNYYVNMWSYDTRRRGQVNTRNTAIKKKYNLTCHIFFDQSDTTTKWPLQLLNTIITYLNGSGVPVTTGWIFPIIHASLCLEDRFICQPASTAARVRLIRHLTTVYRENARFFIWQTWRTVRSNW